MAGHILGLDSDSILPLPDWTWLALLDHHERQRRERDRLAEVWQREMTSVASQAPER